jgi:beta-lactam-binding protein with PASTA domain
MTAVLGLALAMAGGSSGAEATLDYIQRFGGPQDVLANSQTSLYAPVTSAPAGAVVTDVEYKITVVPKPPGTFSCADHVINMLSALTFGFQMLWNNQSGDDLQGIHLIGDTHFFDGQIVNDWWCVNIQHSGSSAPGQVTEAKLTIHYDLPDLTECVDPDWYFSPQSVVANQPGQSFQVKCSVTNNDYATAGAFRVGFYASSDTTIATSDYEIGSVTKPAGLIGAGIICTRCTWSGTFPTNIPPGTYHVGCIIDVDGQVTESNENNNTGLAASTLTVLATVPDVRNMTESAAGTAIQAAGLAVGSPSHTCSDSVASGKVISQNPAGGTPVAGGSTVNLTVSTGNCTVPVPNVVGMTESAAGPAITAAGLTVGTAKAWQCSDTVASGNVVSQKPASGSSAAVGSAVLLTISTGSCSGPKVPVPNVVGMTESAAGSTITSAQLKVGTKTSQCSATVAAGKVISESPSARTSVASGSAVDLTISSGPCPSGIPNVVGMAQAAAQAAITSANFVVGTVTQAVSSTVPKGSVISQDPAAGTSAAGGTAVDLVISTGPSAGPANSCLVARWKLDETSGTLAKDSAGTNNGTLQGGPAWQPTGGKLAGALQFDGVNDYIDCANPALLNVQDEITLACWIKLASFTRVWQAILTKGDNSYRLTRSSAGNSVYFGLGGTSVDGFDGATEIADNEWHHIAGVYDGANATLYIDGIVDTAVPATGQIRTNIYNLFIGENSQTRGRYFKGLLDDVRIYSCALGEREVQAAMLGAEATTPVACWMLDETSGTTAKDSSGNDCNGVVSGGAVWQPTGGKFGGALQFDGVNDFIDCGNPAALNIQDQITLACWIKLASFTRSWQAIVTKGDDSYKLCRSGATSAIYFGLGGTSVDGFEGAAVVTDNEWHHIAGVYDGTQATLYIDGVADTAVPVTGQIKASTYNLFIGENAQARGRYFKGLLDDVRIYNCALNEADIAALVAGTSPVVPAPVQVPNIVGMTQADAQSAITSAGLVVGTIDQASSSTVPQGSVISQTPAAATSVARGSAVNLVVSTGPAVAPGDTSLLAWWKLDDTSGNIVHDSAGLNDGMTYGSPLWQPTGGKIGGALKFDGVNDYVQLSIGPVIKSLTNSTFATWVNWSGQGGNWQRVFDFGSGTTSYMYLTPTGGTSLRFAISKAGSSGESQLDRPSNLATGWHHLAVVIDGATKGMQLYLDGNVIRTGTTQTLPKDLGNTTQNWLGRSQSANPYFNGSLDDFRIYNRVLNAQEIQQLAGVKSGRPNR